MSSGFRKWGTHVPWFIVPFRITAHVGRVAYRLDLPDKLSLLHNIFHVSQLQKCVADYLAVISLDDIQVDECLNHVEKPVAVLD